MKSSFINNTNFKKVTSFLSKNELAIFSKILRVLKPTPEITGFNLIVIRCSECLRVAKKVKWPE